MPARPADAQWEALSALRWGPAVGDATPGIVIPRDWRSEVAAWPHARWVRWRQLATGLLEGQDVSERISPTPDDVRAADRVAYQMVLAEGEVPHE